jgi:hypothetical protein
MIEVFKMHTSGLARGLLLGGYMIIVRAGVPNRVDIGLTRAVQERIAIPPGMEEEREQ